MIAATVERYFQEYKAKTFQFEILRHLTIDSFIHALNISEYRAHTSDLPIAVLVDAAFYRKVYNHLHFDQIWHKRKQEIEAAMNTIELSFSDDDQDDGDSMDGGSDIEVDGSRFDYVVSCKPYSYPN